MFRGKARAADHPKYFLTARAGVSHGGLGTPIDKSLVVPKVTGSNWERTRGLAPIFGGAIGSPTQRKPFASVKADVGVISGLRIPLTAAPGEPGGRIRRGTVQFHGSSLLPHVLGIRVNDSGPFIPKGSSADQIMLPVLKGRSLNLRVQASRYYGRTQANEAATMSYINGRENPPIKSPRQAYNALFQDGAVINGKTYNVAAVIDRKKSILDTVLDKAKRLSSQISGDDRIRVEQYFTEIRSLEQKLAAAKAMGGGTMACRPAGGAPTDPPINDGFYSLQDDLRQIYAGGVRGWSGEEFRAEIMADYLHLAFACDLVRVGVYHMTTDQSLMSAYHITAAKKATDAHGTSHGGDGSGVAEMADVVAWHVAHFSRLIGKLRDTGDGMGGSLLDHCAAHLTWEGGNGEIGDPTNPDASSPTRRWSPHSTENMMVIVAGGAGGLKSGQHIHFNNDRHPAEVVLTQMRALGLPDNQNLGELTRMLPEMFSKPA
jgi:hypothetical protein